MLILLGASLIGVLVVPLLIPVPPLEDTVPPQQLADPDGQFIPANGLDVHYKTAGAGEPCIRGTRV
jgi:hypothetical protein